MDPIPFDKRSGKIWYNGKLVDWKEANLHILSHGLHYASCVFEGERVYNGEIFKLREHTNRLIHSADRMGMKIPYSAEEIDNACKEIISVQNVKSGYVRPVEMEETSTRFHSLGHKSFGFVYDFNFVQA